MELSTENITSQVQWDIVPAVRDTGVKKSLCLKWITNQDLTYMAQGTLLNIM